MVTAQKRTEALQKVPDSVTALQSADLARQQLSDGTLASGSWDRTIKLWDPMTGACTQTLEGHAGTVYALMQLSNGTLASGSGQYHQAVAVKTAVPPSIGGNR